jgi:peptidoglycan/LPS O-acetylase OafA/YrhL
MRDQRIDLLRFTGLSMIILAHVGTPGALFQLRNFDVPLMVLISGMSFALSATETAPNKIEKYTTYVWKRFKRLVLPVWIFLSAFFAVMYLTKWPGPLPDQSTIADSYLLIYGIGYVWIIRVFLLVALVAPFIMKANLATKSNGKFFLFLVAIYIAYECVVRLLPQPLTTFTGVLFENTVLYLVPFGTVFALGLKMQTLKNTTIAKIAMASIAIFILLGLFYYYKTGKIAQTQQYKYPPSLYYLSYAIGVSLLLWLLSGRLLGWIDSLGLSGLVFFVAQNSIWIYLWHIPFVSAITLPFYSKFFAVYGVAVSIAYIQVWGIKRYVVPRIENAVWRKNTLQVLTG